MTMNTQKANKTLKIPKIILLTTKFLAFISTKLVVVFAAKLFTTPLKHKVPKRELEMDQKSKQEVVLIPSIGKKVRVYHFGESSKKILLVHGWSGRGTQLVKFAEEFLKLGYATISFDAPAHGKSKGRTTLMPEFIETILELENKFGPFEAAIGHSLGGMSLLNAVKKGLDINRLVIIGSGNIVKDILDDFVQKLELEPKISELLETHFERNDIQTMNSYSSFHAARSISIPVLIVHDENDDEVPVKCAHHIHENLENSTLLITKNLGHRKILGNPKVIDQVIHFIKNQA